MRAVHTLEERQENVPQDTICMLRIRHFVILAVRTRDQTFDRILQSMTEQVKKCHVIRYICSSLQQLNT